MHPPFFLPHHPVHDHLESPHAKTRRRSSPVALRLRPVAQSWPPLPLLVAADPPPAPRQVPQGKPVPLTVVPPPSATLRDSLGRFLIRLGQRMILQNRPG